MSVGFAAKVASTVAVILSVGLGITGVLSIQTFERTLGEFLSSRFEFVVNDIRQRIETQLDLGLGLSSIQNIPESMGVYVRGDPQIFTIEVFDDSGTVIHSTDTSFEGDLVTEEWMQAWRESGDEGVWALLQRDAGVVGASLRNSFDQEVGSVALRYSRQFLDDSVMNRGSNLLAAGVVVVLVTLILALIGSLLILRRPLRDLADLDASIRGVIRKLSRENGSDDVDASKIRSMEFRTFVSEVGRARDLMVEARDEVRQIDEEQAGQS